MITKNQLIAQIIDVCNADQAWSTAQDFGPNETFEPKLSFVSREVFSSKPTTVVKYSCTLKILDIVVTFRVIGKAKCSEHDNFNESTGFKLADDRAVHKAYSKAQRVTELMVQYYNQHHGVCVAAFNKFERQINKVNNMIHDLLQ